MRKQGPRYPYKDRSLKNLPGETWKDLPGFEGEYKVSSLGRIKSLRRWRDTGIGGYYTTENIRKQFARFKKNKLINANSYTVSTALKRHSVAITRSTARYVYHAFVAPFDLDDKTILIAYTDYDGRNLHYKNLVLTNHSDNAKRSIALNRSKPKFQEYRVPVRQLTMDREIIATYSSITEAENKTGIKLSGIYKCVTGQIFQFQGFRWEAMTKKPGPPAAKPASTPVFNEYLWEKLGKPRTSRTSPMAVLNLSPVSLEGEQWKPIEGLEKAYLISNFGRVKGLSRFKNGRLHIWAKEKMKRLIPDGKETKPTSCLLVPLSKGGKKFQQSVARLVYHHFVKKIDLQDKKIRIHYKNDKCYDLNWKNLRITF